MFLEEEKESNRMEDHSHREEDFRWEESNVLSGMKIEVKEEALSSEREKEEFHKLRMFNKNPRPNIQLGMKFLTPKGYGKLENIKDQALTLADEEGKQFKENLYDISELVKLYILGYNGEESIYFNVTMNINHTVQDIIIKLAHIMNIKSKGQIFYKHQKLDPKKKINKYNLCNGDKLLFEGSKVGEFKRYMRFYSMPDDDDDYWYTGSSSWDAISYIPTVPLTILGFGCFAPQNSSSPEDLWYKIFVNSKKIMEKNIKIQKKSGQKIVDIIFMEEEILEIEAGTNITIAQALSCNHAYKGNEGNRHQEVKENEKGVFKIEPSSEDHNSSCIEYGQIPQIFYTN